MKYENKFEYKVYGDYALFSDPVTRVGGEKSTLPIPTYAALIGVTKSIYFKPTLLYVIDEVKILNPIRTVSKGIRPIKYNGGNDLSMYTYLHDVAYAVRGHFVWNENHPEKGMSGVCRAVPLRSGAELLRGRRDFLRHDVPQYHLCGRSDLRRGQGQADGLLSYARHEKRRYFLRAAREMHGQKAH